MFGSLRRLCLTVCCLLCLLSIYMLAPRYIARDVVLAEDGGPTAARTVQLEQSFSKDPVKIIRVMEGNVEVKPGVPFEAGDEWFKDLSVVIKNVSRKKIVFARIQVRFPETGDGTKEHPTVGDQSSAGQMPDHAPYSGITGQRLNDPPRDPILVEPGHEVTIPVISRLGDDHFEGIKSMIESRQSLSSVTSCVVGLSSFYFDDGTKWASGAYYRPDPSIPGKYNVVSVDEFKDPPVHN